MNTADSAQSSSTPASKTPGNKSNLDSTAFVAMAEQAVVDNFNSHRKPDRSPELTTDGVNLVWMSRGIIGYKAMITSPLAKGLLWEVTYNRPKAEVQVDVFGKLNNVKFNLEADAA